MTKPPISERRLAANRANAKRSTGPRTADGKRRVSRNASKHSLYAPGFRLPADIEQRLYVQSLERTADIADPQFRALTVHRLMLRGHQRRLLQLEGKLWAEALRVNDGAVPQAALWIRQHQSSLVQALNRYDAWIGVRIRAVQRASLPYLIGDEAGAAETVIPAKAATIYAAAAGSTRPIELTRPGSSVPEENRPAKETRRAPMTGLQYLMARNAKTGPVRPASAPQAVRPVRPPRVPGLNLRFLRAKGRKAAQQTAVSSGSPADLKSTASAGTKPSLGPLRTPTTAPFPRPLGGAHSSSNEVSRKPLHPRQSTVPEGTKPTLGSLRTPTRVPFPRPLGGARRSSNEASRESHHLSRSTAPEGTKPSPGHIPTPTLVPFPRPLGGARRNPNQVSRESHHPCRSTTAAETKPSLRPMPPPHTGSIPAQWAGPVATPTKSPESSSPSAVHRLRGNKANAPKRRRASSATPRIAKRWLARPTRYNSREWTSSKK